MIINIPLQVDDEMINSVIARDYERKITDALTKQVENVIGGNASYYSADRVRDGLAVLVDNVVDGVVGKYKEEIVERAAVKLAERISRTKAAKELANA